jgi:hypothetical protein
MPYTQTTQEEEEEEAEEGGRSGRKEIMSRRDGGAISQRWVAEQR